MKAVVAGVFALAGCSDDVSDVPPGELVVHRSPNPHLSFGHGPHHGVGARPAEEFLSRFVERLAGRESQLTLAGIPTWLDTATLRCLDTIPLLRIGASVGDGGRFSPA